MMTSSIVYGHVCMMVVEVTAESHKLATILPLKGWQTHAALVLLCPSLILDTHVTVNWHLVKQDICWPVSRDHITQSSLELIEVTVFLRWPLTNCWFSNELWVHVKLTSGRVVWKPINTNPGLKVNWSVNLSCIQRFF